MIRKKVIILSITFVLLLSLSLPTLSMADNGLETLRQTSKAFSEVAKKAVPAVVAVKVEKTIQIGTSYGDTFGSPFDNDFFEFFFGRPRNRGQAPTERKQIGQGSGFIISKDGYILTNNHVVGKADKINVTLMDGRELDAKIIGSDPESDVAVIKVDAKDLPVINLGNSDDLEVGEWVIAVGNPFGLTETVTVGVVSAKGRSGFGLTDYEDFIQTDAAINPGNSGGPLLNLDGEVVGINTFIVSQSGGYMGIGFAIPINLAKAVENQLVDSGEVTRGYIGIYMNPEGVTPELAKSFGLDKNTGVLIAEVPEDSPADKAGLKSGDIILKLNGKEIKNNASLRNTIALMTPGTTANLTVFRNGKEKDVKVKIGSEEESKLSSKVSKIGKKLGLEVTELTAQLAKRYGYNTDKGVIVTNVERNTPASRAGIEPGMLIVSVNHQYVNNTKEFNEALELTADSKKVLMLVKHDYYAQYVVLSYE